MEGVGEGEREKRSSAQTLDMNPIPQPPGPAYTVPDCQLVSGFFGQWAVVPPLPQPSVAATAWSELILSISTRSGQAGGRHLVLRFQRPVNRRQSPLYE